jgi:hypothetical protein
MYRALEILSIYIFVIVVFRFIIEYNSLKDFGLWVLGLLVLPLRGKTTQWHGVCFVFLFFESILINKIM